jgi:hypothetical protein
LYKTSRQYYDISPYDVMVRCVLEKKDNEA